jgi:hypothetical protein
MVKKIYICCPSERLDEFDAFSTRYPEIVIVFQQQHTLILLVLWDMATFFKDLGRHYDAINQTEQAQTRYRSAYRLRVVIQSELTHQMQNISDNREQ